MTAALPPEEPEIERVLAALDVTAREMERSACAIEQAEKFKAFGETQSRLVEGNRTIAKSAADAARLIRTLLARLAEAEGLLQEADGFGWVVPISWVERLRRFLGARGKEKETHA